jgi:hypothetical protein
LIHDAQKELQERIKSIQGMRGTIMTAFASIPDDEKQPNKPPTITVSPSICRSCEKEYMAEYIDGKCAAMCPCCIQKNKSDAPNPFYGKK